MIGSSIPLVFAVLLIFLGEHGHANTYRRNSMKGLRKKGNITVRVYPENSLRSETPIDQKILLTRASIKKAVLSKMSSYWGNLIPSKALSSSERKRLKSNVTSTRKSPERSLLSTTVPSLSSRHLQNNNGTCQVNDEGFFGEFPPSSDIYDVKFIYQLTVATDTPIATVKQVILPLLEPAILNATLPYLFDGCSYGNNSAVVIGQNSSSSQQQEIILGVSTQSPDNVLGVECRNIKGGGILIAVSLDGDCYVVSGAMTVFAQGFPSAEAVEAQIQSAILEAMGAGDGDNPVSTLAEVDTSIVKVEYLARTDFQATVTPPSQASTSKPTLLPATNATNNSTTIRPITPNVVLSTNETSNSSMDTSPVVNNSNQTTSEERSSNGKVSWWGWLLIGVACGVLTMIGYCCFLAPQDDDDGNNIYRQEAVEKGVRNSNNSLLSSGDQERAISVEDTAITAGEWKGKAWTTEDNDYVKSALESNKLQFLTLEEGSGEEEGGSEEEDDESSESWEDKAWESEKDKSLYTWETVETGDSGKDKSWETIETGEDQVSVKTEDNGKSGKDKSGESVEAGEDQATVKTTEEIVEYLDGPFDPNASYEDVHVSYEEYEVYEDEDDKVSK